MVTNHDEKEKKKKAKRKIDTQSKGEITNCFYIEKHRSWSVSTLVYEETAHCEYLPQPISTSAFGRPIWCLLLFCLCRGDLRLISNSVVQRETEKGGRGYTSRDSNGIITICCLRDSPAVLITRQDLQEIGLRSPQNAVIPWRSDKSVDRQPNDVHRTLVKPQPESVSVHWLVHCFSIRVFQGVLLVYCRECNFLPRGVLFPSWTYSLKDNERGKWTKLLNQGT